MHKLPKNAGQNWYITNNVYVPKAVLCGCYHCGNVPVSFAQEGKTWQKREDSMYISMCCPMCNKNVHFWLRIRKNQENRDNAPNVTDIFIEPHPPLRLNYDSRINKISPDFAEIYRQAVLAEEYGLHSLVGIGYRKALEFLLKDWMCREKPDDAEEIKKKKLGECIKIYIQDIRLKNCLERTVWLGNDETHYIREWPEKDLDDLKKLLALSLNFIAGNLIADELPGEMPSRNSFRVASIGDSERHN
mgnify:CR=1 FL=1